jgi:tetratricopeptide (TPR) repeat protein
LYDLGRLDEMADDAQASLHWAQWVSDALLTVHGHLRLGQVNWRRGALEVASEHLQMARDLVANQGQTVLEAIIWRTLAAAAWKLSNLKMAEEACRRSVQLHQQAGDIRGENRSRHFLGILALESQDYEAVRTCVEPLLNSSKIVGERRMEMGAYALLGQVAGYEGQYEQALTYLAHESQLADELNMLWQIGSNASNTGDVRLRLGDYAGAQASYERALAIFRQVQSSHAQSNVLAFMGLLACLRGQFAEGLASCHTAMQLAQQENAHREQAFAHLFGGHNLVGLGRWQEARQAYEQARTAWQLLGQQVRGMEAQAGKAQAALKLGDRTQALLMVNEVLDYLEVNGADGADDPARMFVTCYEILQQVGDERANMVRERGRALLQTRADRIHDPVLRQAFLENNPAHKTLLNSQRSSL